jgi:hypothetical protein
MASVESVLDAADLTAANRFCTAAHRLPASHGQRLHRRRRHAAEPAAKSFWATAASYQPGPDDLAGLDLGEKDIGGDAGPSTDPDGFAWEAAPAFAGR